MNIHDIVHSIAYCGRICIFCHLAEKGQGCREQSEKCCCSIRKESCRPYQCGIEKELDGCWECSSFPCEPDMFEAEHSVRLQAFIIFLRIFGKEKLAIQLLRNNQKGIEYEKHHYDGLDSEDDVIALLLFGKLKTQK